MFVGLGCMQDLDFFGVCLSWYDIGWMDAHPKLAWVARRQTPRQDCQPAERAVSRWAIGV